MAHSKMTKRGKSYFVEKWNASSKRFINVCKLCGREGYSPSIEDEGFVEDSMHSAMYAELTTIYSPLPLDEFGRCEMCAAAMDKNK
jgi:hypothetical protein